MSGPLSAAFHHAHTIRQILKKPPSDTILQVNGWVKSLRLQKRVGFAMISDGTCAQSLQVVFPDPKLPQRLTNGASVCISGKLVSSPGASQDTELVATDLNVLGRCDPETYPIQKQALTVEYLREHAHLRARTESPGAVLRFRSNVMRTLQSFFESHDFCYTHTPIVTSNDAEGAGETFRLAPVADSDGSASQEFFSEPAFLTVSSQLHLEAVANAVARVWTLSPCFRAERSQTSRHLAEFWMLEAEWAFVQSVYQVCDATEALLKNVLRASLLSLDAAVLWRAGDEEKRARVEVAASDVPWARMTYGEAIEVLRAHLAVHPGAFKFAPEWGKGLQSEHERWLAEQYARGPVFVTDYPTTLKPFYMRANDDGRTVACFDLLVPQIGELIGGSLREERESRLLEALHAHGLDAEAYRWYLELRKYGGAPHGGFGLGFERLISWISGIDNVRECIAFPRWAGRMLL
ncbi:asparaginyl-tRNA synthetase [Vararia minispora EC-137]|uniref:Asparaginyl-tRNA synthetase n=1 Tax=Vararia minispora EC-137 TaxID=1314806 RepID=A0ACB8QKL0_9AGAM|nr:asparaginyl-tRNA synthetase [Vararia minispora EC-137]